MLGAAMRGAGAKVARNRQAGLLAVGGLAEGRS
jgi:hypothetical protein